MLHHKAPHRPWQPDPAYAAKFATRRIPEPATLWDSYATRTDALHENQQRVVGRPDAARSQARAAAGPRRRGADQLALGPSPTP